MRLHHTILALSLIAAPSACTARQDKSPDASPVREPAPAEVANPMASFARMVSGEWKMTALSGTSTFDTWHWGPGRHSMRVMTDGSGAAGGPWRELQVFYWHPGRKQVCLLGLSPAARGVAEGTIKFEGEAADGVFDLYQTGGRRKMGLRWDFDGPDKYHATLLEATGPDGLKPMNEWDYVRFNMPTATRPPTAEKAPKPSEHLKSLTSLLGHSWEAKGDWATGDAFHIQSTFEWVPYADGIYASTFALTKDGEPMHLLDAYFYHHTGTDALRCLALSNRGGVYEGDLTVLDGGALQLDLKGYEGDRGVPHVVRFDFEQDGTLRHRVWSIGGTERTLMLDVHHKELKPTDGAQPVAAATASVKGGDRVASGIGLAMVYVEPQTFAMGSPKDVPGYDPDETQHTVTITKGYWLGETEVTQKMWREVMGTEPWKGQRHVIEGDTVAASYVDWDEAVEFCRRLTLREGQAGRLPPGYEYCLPTEAEWELACRGGSTAAYSFGGDEERLGEFAVFRDNRDGEHAHRVKSRKANGFGFFDMHGNVWEWCADERVSGAVPGYTDGDGVRDPYSRGGSQRVIRGCGFYTSTGVTSAIRRDMEHGERTVDMGFRPALAARSSRK